MRVNLPGLMMEKQRSGRYTYRVRVCGDKTRKIAIGVDPEHPEFMIRYEAARRGETYQSPDDQGPIPKSVAWLSLAFEAGMQERVAAGLMHPTTLKQRRAFFDRLRADHGEKHMAMPREKVIEIRDGMMATPGAADNMVKTIRALYAWAVERGHVADNPALGIGKINRGTGAVPWSIDDLSTFRDRHPKGTMAHLSLTLFTFTACRIGDAFLLGRGNEVKRDGITYLDWQPAKKGSTRVVVPILPPLADAIAEQKVVGPAYLMTGWGKPFASSAAFGNWFRDRVAEAGLEGRSPHGIRKAAGELLALEGASQYHIMAVHGHTQAKTSEHYTSGVNRQRLAAEAMRMLGNLEW
ncbi:tyrosine-type recombinase/integrase [Antarcticimicrobium sediminis]|uniref:Site-specific integrase n=1 Tax=Antarcticimicrobium sediminis TaxID=2546227 RepID=A0A4R5EI56_9RHOB|nr:tyrosine-type recombinase/integrase [Antarcticimicrobium sediminis]TDE34159.1 site-specific integrase [Antarcticimicrobium sediminis]